MPKIDPYAPQVERPITFDDAKFKAFENAIDDQFERFFSGALPRHKLRRWLVDVCAFTTSQARAEIREQIGVYNFQQKVREKDEKQLP